MPNYVCFSKQDWPVSDRSEWDGDAVRQRLWEHFGWDGERNKGADGGETRSAFLLSDADGLNSRSAYQHPICDVIDGQPTVTRGALRVAASGLGQAKDISDRERKRARGVIDRYYATLNAKVDDDEERGLLISTMPIGSGRIVKPQRILETDAEGNERAMGVSMPDLPEKLLEQVHDREALAETPLYLFPASASSNLPDTYGTRMLKSSMTNYVRSAQAGLPLVNSHRKDMLPIGRIYDGRMQSRDGVTRSVFEQYMAMGDYEVSGIKTASVVQGIRLGINRDTSIGFYGGRILCSICKRSMPTSFWDLLFGDEDEMCLEHMPLVEYEELDADGKGTGNKVTCYGDVDGANCGEMSLVFKGANPDTQVISGKRTQLTFEEAHTPVLSRAIALDQLGRLGREAAAAIDQRFNLSGRGYRFDTLAQRYSLSALQSRSTEQSDTDATAGNTENPPDPAQASKPDTTTQEQEPMGAKNDTQSSPPAAAEQNGGSVAGNAAADPPAGGDRSALASSPSGAPADGNTAWHGTLRGLLREWGAVDDGFTGDPVAHLRNHFTGELPKLRNRADLGERMLKDLREETSRECVRAFGKDKTPAVYDGIIERADEETLKGLREQFRAQAAERGLKGGRASTDGDDGSVAPQESGEDIPDLVYAAR